MNFRPRADLLRSSNRLARQLFRGGVSLLMVGILALPTPAKTCIETACVSASGQTASVTPIESTMMNAMTTLLLGSPTLLNLTENQWEALGAADIPLQDLLDELEQETGLSGTAAVLAGNVTLVQVVDAASTALTANGDTAGASALASLRPHVAGIGTPIQLEDMLQLCASCTDLDSTTINTRDLFAGIASLYDQNSGNTSPGSVTLSGAELGLGGAIDGIEFSARVSEPPLFVCGEAGTQFYSGAVRTKLTINLNDSDLTGALTNQLAAGMVTLPPGVSGLEATLAQIQIYGDFGRAQGTIQTVDADGQTVTVQATPGFANLYLGQMDDSKFWDTSRTINPTNDLSSAEIGQFKANVGGVPVTATLKARAVGSGENGTSSPLIFSGPFPQTQTLSTSATFADNLVASLLANLEVEAEIIDPPDATLVQTAFDNLFATVRSSLTTTYSDALSPTVVDVLTDVVDPALVLLGIGIGETDITVRGVGEVCTVEVSGYAYRDANVNVVRDAEETGTGLTLYAKLVPADSPGGPAAEVVAVDPATGLYTFIGLAGGTNIIVIDDNNTLSDVTPAAPAGWTVTESPSLQRQVVTAGADISGINFGLAQGRSYSGVVFEDTGAGAGTANDGAKGGTEAGLAGVTVKLTDSAGTTVYDTTTTDADGRFTLHDGGAVSAGAALKIVQQNLTGHQSTGAKAGSSGGTYDRASDSIAFTLPASGDVTGVEFGDVPTSVFRPDGRQAANPGGILFYAHEFVAGTAGEVTFSTVNAASPDQNGWTHLLHRDANGNGKIDPGEAQVTGPITVAAGETVNLVLKEFIPSSAPLNAQDTVTILADFQFASAPALNETAVVRDVTTVGQNSTAGLTLLKAVDKPTARPGDQIVYTLTYANQGYEPLSDIVIYDTTPAFTTFVRSASGSLPDTLTGVVTTEPGVGTSGSINWTFSGALAPGASGSVTFAVRVD